MTDAFYGTCRVIKRHKRLYIEIMENERVIYTPPDFVKLQSREPLHRLATAMTECQRRDILLIAAFEGANASKRRR